MVLMPPYWLGLIWRCLWGNAMYTTVYGDALSNNGENIIHKAFTHYLDPFEQSEQFGEYALAPLPQALPYT